MSDILNTIDALIDEQLAAGESGAQERAAEHDRLCPHCGREWHGLAITERMERMRREYADAQFARYLAGDEESEYAESAILDEDYRYAEDDSRVICPGSEFIGPIPPCHLGVSRRAARNAGLAIAGGVWWAESSRTTELVSIEWLDDVLAAAGLPVTYELRRAEIDQIRAWIGRVLSWPNPALNATYGFMPTEAVDRRQA